MELFKFNVVTDPTILEQGESIKRFDRVMWVERYSEPGEFEIEAPLSSGLRDFLPLGTLISHADTMEVMIVENQTVGEKTKENPTLTISGRSFDSFLENRIVGMDLARASGVIAEYILASNYTWDQIVSLINDHIQTPTNADDAVTNVYAATSISATSVSEARTIDRGTLYDRVHELLAIDDLGIKTVRRSPYSSDFGGTNTATILLIHAGEDHTHDVIFSWTGGDLDAIEYLFSNKALKNAALVVSKYYYIPVDGTETKYNRRTMIVDASDLDESLTAPAAGLDLIGQVAKMQVRGRAALAAQNTLSISQADIAKMSKYQYRKDYNIGDLVTLESDYRQTVVVRITEYAEIEDENGESGHPTLSFPGA